MGDFEGFGADGEEDVVEFDDEVVVLGVDTAAEGVHVEHGSVPVDAEDVGEVELETVVGVARMNDEVKGGIVVVVVDVADEGFTEVVGAEAVVMVEDFDALDLAAG